MLTLPRLQRGEGALPMGELRKAGLIAALAAAGACCQVATADSVGSGTPTTQAPAHPIIPAPAFKPSQLTPVSRADWVTNGGNLANQRYSALDQINRDNVSQVKAVWRASLRGSGLDRKTSGQAQPIEYDGTLYTITGQDDVFAISVETGEVLWEYQAHLDPAKVAVCCGWVSRGVGIGDGKIFVGQLDNQLVALDQRTGNIVWSAQSETLAEGGYSITAAPLYYDGLVIVGHAGGEMAIRGRLKAFDARTGRLKWVFYTIPAPGEPGHETWPTDTDAWRHGGAAIWNTPAIDPQLGLIFLSTDNPAPDLNGAGRAGDNLYTDSILALDARTGKYRWHYQEVHHDIWDYGTPNPVVLFDATVQGHPRKGLAQLSKDGYAYILDRVTGKPLIGIDEQPVPQSAYQKTSPTQPIPVGDDIVPHAVDIAPDGIDLVNQGRTFTPFEDKPVVYKPLAGISWPPSSYDPTTHTLFVCANDGLGVLTAKLGPVGLPANWDEHYLGGTFGRVDAARRGIFAALDVTTNRLVWRRQWNEGCSSGSVNTAGGLVFVGRSDGRLLAYDKTTGLIRWQFQVDAGVNAPATVFEYKGVEYVAVMAAGTVYSTGPRGDGLWLFSLQGKLDPLPPLTSTPATPGGQTTPSQMAAAMPEGPANLVQGKDIYKRNCEPCHGPDGSGGHGEGAPLTSKLTAATIYATADQGRKTMPSFHGVLTPGELRDVAHFIAEQLIRQ
jgi:quinohemoprotein ethanol dehydrogenase